jgi:hypothetical protein
MKKITAFAFLLQISLIVTVKSQNKKEQQYIVLEKGDTIYCKEVSKTTFGDNLKCGNGSKEEKYDGDGVKAYALSESKALLEKGSYRKYEKHPYKPSKPDRKRYFMEIVIQNEQYKLLVYESYSGGTYGAGGTNVGGSSSDYYIYTNDDEFVTKVKAKDKTTLHQYFGKGGIRYRAKAHEKFIDKKILLK